MHDLTVLKNQLARIARALDDPQFLLPRSNDEAIVKHREDRLSALQSELQDICRRLPGIESAVGLQERQLKSIPRDHRWPAQHRVNQLNTDLDDVRKLADLLAQRVLDLLKRNGTLDFGQKTKAVKELAEYGDKILGHGTGTEILKASSGAVIQPAVQPMPTLSDVVPLVMMACVGLKYLIDKFRSPTS
jgi:hypothetical protein